jgi:hypothetical protein
MLEPQRTTKRFCNASCRTLARYRRARPKSALVRKTPLRVRGDDCYETPPEAVEALLAVEDVPPLVWEPACGPGAIARVLRAHGRRVVATDLVDYQSPDQDAARVDFLLDQTAPEGCQCIITNPPYKLGGEFVAHALRLVPTVIMLLRLAFYESTGRANILDCGRLARVHLFANRLPMMHRRGHDGQKIASSAMAFAWFCWDAAHHGPPTFNRITWGKTQGG